MSRIPLSALLCAVAMAGAVLAGEADATPRMDREASSGEQEATLVLPKAAIGAAVRRTAVADRISMAW